MRWPWERGRKQELIEETERLRRRLKRIEKDDVSVRDLATRAADIMRENDLVNELRRALGMHR